MSAGTPTFSSRDLLESFKPFRRRLVGLDTGRVAIVFATAVLLYLLSFMWLDTVVELSAPVRWFVTRIGLFLAAVALLVAVVWRIRKFTDARIADRIDRSIDSGGEVLAGLQLAVQPVHPQSALSQGFAAIASQRAAERVKTLKPEVVGTWKGLKQVALYFACAMATVAALGILTPNMAWHQLQRFLFPSRDIPQYTGVQIELILEKDSVLYGQDAFVSATVAGARLDRMSLVVRTDQGQEHQLPMLAQDESKWQAILTRVTEPLTLYAKSGSSRSQMRRLDVQLTPQILPVKVVITPPAYTRGSVYRGVLPDQGIVGLAGTEVKWEVASNRPLRSGRLLVTYAGGESDDIELKPMGEDELTTVGGTMLLSRPGQFELSVTDLDGIQSHESVSGSIKIIDDRRPIVRIVQPQQQSLATPDVKLPVVVAAEDDFGITSLTLYRSLNGSPATPVAATFDESARVESRWELPLMSFGLVPGDEIQLFARTEDNDPAGAKGAESPVTTIRIISVEQFQEMMIQKRGAESIQAKYQAARRYFDQLASALRKVEEAAEALEKSPDFEEAKQQLQKSLEEAKQAAEKAAEETEKLSKQPMPIDVDRELAKRLEEMSQQAGEFAERLEEMQANAKPNLTPQDKQDVSKMLEESGQVQKQLTDQAIDPLQKMQKMMPLIVDQQRFTQIAQQQRDLAGRLNSLRESDTSDPAVQRRVAELESEQEQLKQQLDQLLADIEKHAAELPLEPEFEKLQQTATEFVRAVRDSEAMTEMSGVQQNLLDDKYPGAHANADKAAEILESFLSQCNGMGEKACQNCEAAFNPSAGGCKLGNSIDQMLAMMGMKPGSSGMKPGGSPGMGMGFGAGGGYAQRFPGPQNVGMYGSMPMPQTSPSRGRGDQQSQGFQTSQAIESGAAGEATGEAKVVSEATGQSMNAVPAKYRGKVAEYFRNLSENIGNKDQE